MTTRREFLAIAAASIAGVKSADGCPLLRRLIRKQSAGLCEPTVLEPHSRPQELRRTQALERRGFSSGTSLVQHGGTYYMAVEHRGVIAIYSITSSDANWGAPIDSIGSNAKYPRFVVSRQSTGDEHRIWILYATTEGSWNFFMQTHASLRGGSPLSWSRPVRISGNQEVRGHAAHGLKCAHFTRPSRTTAFVDNIAITPSTARYHTNVFGYSFKPGYAERYHINNHIMDGRLHTPEECSAFSHHDNQSVNAMVRSNRGLYLLVKPYGSGTPWAQHHIPDLAGIHDFACVHNRNDASRIEVVYQREFGHDLYHASLNYRTLAMIGRPQRVTTENFLDCALVQASSSKHLKLVGTTGDGNYSHHWMNIHNYQWNPGWVHHA